MRAVQSVRLAMLKSAAAEGCGRKHVKGAAMEMGGRLCSRAWRLLIKHGRGVHHSEQAYTSSNHGPILIQNTANISKQAIMSAGGGREPAATQSPMLLTAQQPRVCTESANIPVVAPEAEHRASHTSVCEEGLQGRRTRRAHTAHTATA